MTRWVMVADLERCVGCQTCTAACRHTNATSPAVQWRKVLDIEIGNYPKVSRVFVPVGCQHCNEPPCMHVCPTTATRQRADGIVTIDYDVCIGCAYCEVACPYQARFLVHEPHFAYGPAMQNEVERADASRVGVAQKCTFCSDRIDFGVENELVPGIDPRATPACVNACIADALHFGDIDDPNSNISRLLREQKSFRMHEELGTEPGFHYVYGKANDIEALADPMALPSVSSGSKIRTREVEPALQQHWDWKAAGNFICGGIGSGLFFFGAITSLRYGEVRVLCWPALGIVALGLFLVLLKIGRPLRFAYVLRQPQRSWMAREAWIATVLFPLAALALISGMPGLLIGAAAVALLFLCSQAMILKEAKGIPAWRTMWILPLMVVTGVTEGSGLFLAAIALSPRLLALAQVIVGSTIVMACLRAWIWRSYLMSLAIESAPTRTLSVLYGCGAWFFTLGLALPSALIILGLIEKTAAAPAFAVAGISVVAAGGLLKFILVTRAAFNQGFALTHTPVRGSGIAGPPVKPGWSTS